MAAESFGGALLLFRSGQIFLAGGDGPTHSERIAQVPVAVAPELVGDRHGDFATGRDSLRPGCVGVGNVEVEMKRQAALASGGIPNSAPKSSANTRMESPMRTCACINLPPGPGDPEISSPPNAFFRKSMYWAAPETARWTVNE